MKKYIYLSIATVSMCIYGLMYTWTIFSLAVQGELNCTPAQFSFVFSLCLIIFCLGGLASGFLYGKVSFKYLMFLSSIAAGFGIILTGMQHSIYLIYILYGLLYGFGAGFGYKTTLTAIISWFPKKAGLASGILFMGTGLTAFIFNVPASYIISKLGWRAALYIIGGIALTITMIAAIVISPAPNDPFAQQSAKQISKWETEPIFTTTQMLKSRKFYFYFIWSIAILAGCMAIAGNASACAISLGIPFTKAAVYTTAISLFNSISRVFYGYIYDKKGRNLSMMLSTILYIGGITCLLFSLGTNNIAFLLAAYILIGLSFGAVPAISSVYILKTFGSRYYSSNFSIQGFYTMFSSFLGPAIIGIIYTADRSFLLSYQILIVYGVLAVLCLYILNSIKD